MPRKKKLETALENLLTPPSENAKAVKPGALKADVPSAASETVAAVGEPTPAGESAPEAMPEAPEVTALPETPPEAASPSPESHFLSEGLEEGGALENLAEVAAAGVTLEEEEDLTFAEEAAVESEVEAAGTERQLVILMLADEWYGVDIAAVEQIIELQRITPVPHTPAYIAGLTNLRGTVLPVVDLRRRLGLPAGEPTRDTRIVVAQAHQMQVGMIVDAVTEVLRVPESAIEPPSPLMTSVDSMYIRGIAKVAERDGAPNTERLIVLLDLEQILPGVRGH